MSSGIGAERNVRGWGGCRALSLKAPMTPADYITMEKSDGAQRSAITVFHTYQLFR